MGFYLEWQLKIVFSSLNESLWLERSNRYFILAYIVVNPSFAMEKVYCYIKKIHELEYRYTHIYRYLKPSFLQLSCLLLPSTSTVLLRERLPLLCTSSAMSRKEAWWLLLDSDVKEIFWKWQYKSYLIFRAFKAVE